jgi:hypothetical protein
VKHHPTTTGYYENVFTVWLNGYRGIETIINNIGEATVKEGKPYVVPVYIGPKNGVSNNNNNAIAAVTATTTVITSGDGTKSLSSKVSTPSTLRRSKRDTNAIKLEKSTSLTFHRRLQSLFFSSPTQEEYESIILAVGSRRQSNNDIMSVYRATQSSETPIYVIDNFLTESDLDYFDEKIKSLTFEQSFVDNMNYDNDDDDTAMEVEDDSGNSDEKKQQDRSSEESIDNTPSKKKRRRRKSRTILDDTHRTSTFHSFRKLQDSKISTIEQRVATLMGKIGIFVCVIER